MFLVGPTGVGKTTTLAKLAATLLLKQRRSVALISTDTFRVGAVAQLQVYAEILGVPLAVAYTPRELAPTPWPAGREYGGGHPRAAASDNTEHSRTCAPSSARSSRARCCWRALGLNAGSAGGAGSERSRCTRCCRVGLNRRQAG